MKRKLTVRRDPRDFRDLYYRSANYVRESQLPAAVDLRKGLSPVVNQGSLGSCTSNAIVSGLREYWLRQNGYPDANLRLSRLFHYWHERDLEGTVNRDSGATIRDGMKVLQKIGVCPESEWPYQIAKFKVKPDREAEATAGEYRIESYHRIHDLAGIKAALADGQPVVFGIWIYASFESLAAARTGRIPYPNRSKEMLLGGHAMLAVGYRDGKKKGQGVVIARNSWGRGWGDQGYCYLPYAFFKNRLLTFDYWTGK
ncbi:C1 family peptidase [Paenibacillus sp. GCM10023248]|uniref:C1 family peptidase n=1 Tax=Bacillales TaxID=1385 RepID=UPI00237963AC|nr:MULTISPECIES: C1 family peptidase [Bacillales]MDD9268749.1 C1 family peptidase [Paenibacillus sp. MAHUQ-63]MDR6882172.1 C1A family cysteine protease [Bacillus sp. 3255]